VDKTILRPWLELARVSNLPTVWTNVLAAWLLAGGKWEWRPLAWLLAGASLIYTGGMFLNDAADVKFDREHRKERPIPSGRVSLAQAWVAALGFLAAGFVLFVRGAEACIWLTGALVAAIVLYDLYHKPWPGSVFIMGSCRTFLYLATASAVTGTLDIVSHAEVIAKAVALGGFVTGVSLAARGESKSAPLHPALRATGLFGLALPALVSLLLPLGTGRGLFPSWPALVWIAAVATLVMVARRIMRTPPPSNIGRAVGLLLAGIAWVDALATSTLSPLLSLGFGLSLPLLLLWQRKIAAT
jgi:4-hydroxybenzoate polyprenyltransferase